MNILADENIPALDYYLDAMGAVRRTSGRNLQRSQLEGVDALLVRSVTRVDEALLHGSAVKFVGTATSGIDHIDLDYLRQQGIGFAHAPGSNANSVVEYVLSAIASVADKLERLLAGGTVGIVGYGVIGKAVAARLHALGISYRAYDPWLDPQSLKNPAELAEVLACDVVTLHPELTRKQPWPSFHLLGKTELERLHPHTLLINASRGPVVDNSALLSLLSGGRGPITVLDVWEGEPNVSSKLLSQVAYGSAHIAGYSLDGKILATRMLCAALAAQLDLAPPREGSPAGEPASLVSSGDVTGAGLVRHLLQCRYDISVDDALLRDAIAGRAATASASAVTTAGFDLLRKEYRERRELLGSAVRGVFRSPQDIALVRGLGCIPSPDGDSA